MNIKKINFGAQNVSFSGHTKKLDKRGNDIHSLYYLYDPKKWSCDVEIYNVNQDDKGNLSVGPLAKTINMKDGLCEFNVRRTPEITSKLGFAYRFKLTENLTEEQIKEGKKPDVSYAFDNGTVVGIFDNADKYNVVLNNRATINKNGAMQLIMPDGYYPGVVKGSDGKPHVDDALRAIALTSARTHANKLGGNLHGIIQRLDEIANNEGVSRIVGTPFTKDTISSHLYWTENAYRVCPNLGTEEDFKTLQVELFKRGINWIADAALVNEGFGGIHMSELLRKGENSVSKNMFRTDEKISLGIIPDDPEGNTTIKLINAPFSLSADGKSIAKNENYDKTKPTFVQFYDIRLATPEQVKSDKPMDLTTYAKKNTDNIYEITRHDDAVYPFPIEVDPDILELNVSTLLKQKGSIDLKDVDAIKAIMDFKNFNVVNKSAAAGLEVWDGNVDIAKLNFYMSLNDDSRFSHLPSGIREDAVADFRRGALAVRDYAINSGRHWTKLAADAQLKYATELIGSTPRTAQEYLTFIERAQKKGELPATVNEVDIDVLNSVLRGTYKSRRLNTADVRSELNKLEYANGNIYQYEDYILKQAMDVPLETLPVATNLLGVLTSPYIAKKANIESELGVSRYDLYKAENPNLPAKYNAVYSRMDDIYQDDLMPIMKEIFSGVKGLCDENTGKVTPFGKFAIAELAPDLTKYLLLKSLNPNAQVIVKDGEFDFSKVDEDAITIQSLGIKYNDMNSEQEALKVVKTIKNGLSAMSPDEINKLKNAVNTRLSKRSIQGYRVAEMILDRSESGLGWRIDAAKDIASIDSVRKGVDSMEQAFDNVTDFWAKYNQTILLENPHAYTTAEMTDLDGLFGAEAPSKYKSAADAERKFLEATGITSIANYNYFFSLLPDLFAQLRLEDFDDSNGWQAREELNKNLLSKMNAGWGNNPGFLFNSPDDGVKNAYNFVGNHDKARILHLLALDSEIVKSGKIQDAMGARLKTAFASVVDDETQREEIEKAIDEMVNGKFKGMPFDPTAFGTRPFDVAIDTVLEQVAENGIIITDVDKVKKDVLKSILEPAFDRYLSIYKTLVTLPGSPTDFAGDRVGNSGYETKAKNYHQQNRNVIHWEWINEGDDGYLSYVHDFYNEANKIANLRKIPELSALNNGDTITLKVLADNSTPKNAKLSDKVQSILRYNDEGSCVLCFYNSSGASSPINEKMDRTKGVTTISTSETIIPEEESIDAEVQKTSTKNKKAGFFSGFRKKQSGNDLSSGVKTNKTNGQTQVLSEDRLYLYSDAGNQRSGLKHGLEVGMEFYNASKIGTDEKPEKYVVAKDNAGNYYLQKFFGEKTVKPDIGVSVTWDLKPSPVTIDEKDNNVLVLYQPKK